MLRRMPCATACIIFPNLSHLITAQVESTLPNRILEVLNLASGPGRDMLFFFRNNPEVPVRFYCVEQDRRAIEHAKSLCHEYLEDIVFHAKNALRFKSDKTYDLIWSAGLFDYFSDTVFVFMLHKLAAMVARSGEIVIGNFSTKNPSKPYMELFEWNLHHRSPSTLKALAEEAGFHPRADEGGKGVRRESFPAFARLRNNAPS